MLGELLSAETAQNVIRFDAFISLGYLAPDAEGAVSTLSIGNGFLTVLTGLSYKRTLMKH